MNSQNKRRFSLSPPSSYQRTVTHIFLSVFIVALMILTAGPSPAFAEETCRELLMNRCEVCHYNTRVCWKVQKKKGKGSWKRTVKNMVKQGAKLNNEEREKLIDCLSAPTPEIIKFCGNQVFK